MMIDLDKISTNFPFLSGIRHQNKEFIGIILNCDDKIISWYDFDMIKSQEEKKTFLELGDEWWWASNRQLPIHIFLLGRMTPFRYCVRTTTTKDIQIMFGPVTSLNNLIQKRIKKRQIQLIKKVH